MGVEIQILSGARQGERFELDDDAFRVGDSTEHSVRFDSQRDPGAKNRSLLIQRQEDGWHVRNEGAGPIWINQRPVHSSSPIRSSDVIRLSESGPDLSFIVHARKSKVNAIDAAAPVVLPPAPSALQPIAVRPTTAQPIALQPAPSTPSPVTQRPASTGWALGLALVASCLLLIVAGTLWLRRPVEGLGHSSGAAVDPSADLTAPVANEGTSDSGPRLTGLTVPVETDQTQQSSTSASNAPPESDAWLAAAEKNRAAVYALAVQSPGGLMWSFGTCFAIRPDTVVTTASLATEIEKLRSQDKGWKVWVIGPEKSVQHEVRELRVHVGYTQAIGAGKPPHFFDVALLTVEGELPRTCEIASQAELDRVTRQSRVGCLGIAQQLPQEGEQPDPIARFDLLAPEFSSGRLLDVAQLPGGQHAPRLLFLPNTFTPTLWGSPIFNESGKVIGVFAMVEQRDKDSSVAVLVAPILDSVADWLRDSSTDLWVAARVPDGKAGVEKKR